MRSAFPLRSSLPGPANLISQINRGHAVFPLGEHDLQRTGVAGVLAGTQASQRKQLGLESAGGRVQMGVHNQLVGQRVNPSPDERRALATVRVVPLDEDNITNARIVSQTSGAAQRAVATCRVCWAGMACVA